MDSNSPLHLAEVRVFRKLEELCGRDIEKWQLVDYNLDRLLKSPEQLYEEWRWGRVFREDEKLKKKKSE